MKLLKYTMFFSFMLQIVSSSERMEHKIQRRSTQPASHRQTNNLSSTDSPIATVRQVQIGLGGGEQTNSSIWQLMQMGEKNVAARPINHNHHRHRRYHRHHASLPCSCSWSSLSSSPSLYLSNRHVGMSVVSCTIDDSHRLSSVNMKERNNDYSKKMSMKD